MVQNAPSSERTLWDGAWVSWAGVGGVGDVLLRRACTSSPVCPPHPLALSCGVLDVQPRRLAGCGVEHAERFHVDEAHCSHLPMQRVEHVARVVAPGHGQDRGIGQRTEDRGHNTWNRPRHPASPSALLLEKALGRIGVLDRPRTGSGAEMDKMARFQVSNSNSQFRLVFPNGAASSQTPPLPPSPLRHQP